jgi:hypothetical protein
VASALLGAMTFGGAIIVSPLLAALPFSTGLTMAVVMAICSVLSLLSTLLFTRPSD